jgi:hypothetical protein
MDNATSFATMLVIPAYLYIYRDWTLFKVQE